MTGRRVTFIDEAPKASATGTTRGDEPSIESTIEEERRPSARQSPGLARRLSSAAWDLGSNLLRPAFRPSNKVRTSERGSIESLRGQRRHTVSALANSASNFVPGKNSNPNSPNGSNGADGLEPHETFETRDSGQITLEIHQDVDELQLLSEALDNNHQANVRIWREGPSSLAKLGRPNLDLWVKIWAILEDFGDFRLVWTKGGQKDP